MKIVVLNVNLSLDTVGIYLLQQSGTFSFLPRELHLGALGEVPETLRDASEHLDVSGGGMKSFGGALEHLRATSHQVIPPWGQRGRHRLKHNRVRARGGNKARNQMLHCF